MYGIIQYFLLRAWLSLHQQLCLLKHSLHFSEDAEVHSFSCFTAVPYISALHQLSVVLLSMRLSDCEHQAHSS